MDEQLPFEPGDVVTSINVLPTTTYKVLEVNYEYIVPYCVLALNRTAHGPAGREDIIWRHVPMDILRHHNPFLKRLKHAIKQGEKLYG